MAVGFQNHRRNARRVLKARRGEISPNVLTHGQVEMFSMLSLRDLQELSQIGAA